MQKTLSQKGLEIIKNCENFSSVVYPCLKGQPTIGYGHALLQFEDYTTISEKKALELLASDVKVVEGYINKYVKIDLSQGKFDALVSLVFNWKITQFKASKGLAFLNAGDYKNAAIQFFSKQYGVVKVNGKFCQGLYNRRQTEEKELWNS